MSRCPCSDCWRSSAEPVGKNSVIWPVPCSIGELLEHRQGLLRGLQVLAFRALELLVIAHVVVVGVDDDLRQLAGLTARGPAKGRPIGEGDHLRRLRLGSLLGTLHGELLSLPGTAGQRRRQSRW